MLTPEEQVIIDSDRIHYMNNLLKNDQFSIGFLIYTREYYNGDICLLTQRNLSPEFCFKYIYNKECDGDRVVTYDQIEKYLLNRFTKDEIKEFFFIYVENK
jgi:hypothetical protein